jgi:hypothetical protein
VQRIQAALMAMWVTALTARTDRLVEFGPGDHLRQDAGGIQADISLRRWRVANFSTVQNTYSFGNNSVYLFPRDGTQYFNAGEMDDLRIYNFALTAAEIQQL